MEQVETQNTPATAQEVENAKQIIFKEEAEKILSLNSYYTLSEMFLRFQELMRGSDNEKLQKQLLDAKNILHRLELERQIEETGKFTVIVPFDTVCVHCSGAGERLRFYLKEVEVDCKYCKNGTLIVPCKSCKGTGEYIKPNSEKVPCNRCNKEDPESGIDETTGNPIILVGKRRVKCKSCANTGKVGRFKKTVLDSKIKSTTPCKSCQGKGYHDEKKKKSKIIDNPCITQSLGQEIKKAVAKE